MARHHTLEVDQHPYDGEMGYKHRKPITVYVSSFDHHTVLMEGIERPGATIPAICDYHSWDTFGRKRIALSDVLTFLDKPVIDQFGRAIALRLHAEY
jgi:hypothetical protein